MKTYFFVIEDPSNLRGGDTLIAPQIFEDGNALVTHYRNMSKDKSYLTFKVQIQDNESLENLAKTDKKGNVFYKLDDFAKGDAFQLTASMLTNVITSQIKETATEIEKMVQKKPESLVEKQSSSSVSDPYHSQWDAVSFLKKMPTSQNSAKIYAEIAHHWRNDETVFKCGVMPQCLLKAGQLCVDAAKLIMTSRLANILKPSELISIYYIHRENRSFQENVSDIHKFPQSAWLRTLFIKDSTVAKIIEGSDNLLSIFRQQEDSMKPSKTSLTSEQSAQPPKQKSIVEQFREAEEKKRENLQVFREVTEKLFNPYMDESTNKHTK